MRPAGRLFWSVLISEINRHKGWRCLKADIKSAFLPGPASQEARQLFVMSHTGQGIGGSHGRAVQVLKPAYGLVNALAELYKSALKPKSVEVLTLRVHVPVP